MEIWEFPLPVIPIVCRIEDFTLKNRALVRKKIIRLHFGINSRLPIEDQLGKNRKTLRFMGKLKLRYLLNHGLNLNVRIFHSTLLRRHNCFKEATLSSIGSTLFLRTNVSDNLAGFCFVASFHCKSFTAS